MKTSLAITFLLTLFTFNLSAHRHVKGSDKIVTSYYDLNDFSKIKVSHAISVQLVQAKDFKVEVSHNDNLKEYIDIKVSGNTLEVRLKNGRSYRNTKINAVISLPNVEGIELSGASTLKADLLKIEKLNVELSGASQFQAKVQGSNLSIHGSGASTFNVVGEIENLTCHVSGATNVRAKNLIVKSSTTIHASGACDMSLTCHGEISASMSGASDLVYFGDAKMVQRSTSGASSIKQKAL